MAKNKEPLLPRGEPPTPGWLSRKATSLLGLFEGHPFIRLVAILWVLVWSVWGPIDSCRKERQAAKLQGTATRPRVFLRFSFSQCYLRNEGPRPIAEASLQYHVYHFSLDGPCRMPRRSTSPDKFGSGAGAAGTLSATAGELKAHEPLTASLLPESLCEEQRAFLQDELANQKKQPNEYATIVECNARYHRPADMEPFAVSTFAFLTRSCREGKPAEVMPFEMAVGFDDKTGGAGWSDPSFRSAWHCFTGLRTAEASHWYTWQQADSGEAATAKMLDDDLRAFEAGK